MLAWLQPGALARTYRDPISWAILLVDLFPIYAVFQFGWDATSLVFLYWLENLIIGGVTLLRMFAASVNGGPLGAVSMFFFGPFFTVHYGMFCFVHGIFLAVFASATAGGMGDTAFVDPVSLVGFALSTGDQMMLFIFVIIALQLLLFIRDFLIAGEFRETAVPDEMMKPYGRIIVLHVALFVGFGVMLALGQPMIGVLSLILLRALWGAYQAYSRHIQPQRETVDKVDEASSV